MPTLLDNVTEKHEGPEPRILTEDVQKILRRVIRPGDDDSGESVALIAGKCRPPVSTRTVYRVLNPDESKKTIGLDLADRLCLAADAWIGECRVVQDDGSVVSYLEDSLALDGVL